MMPCGAGLVWREDRGRMTTFELTLAIAALLITPGPTNTLLAVAGAERGVARAVRLIPAELAGYLTTVTPLALLGGTLLAAAPEVRPVITAVAALWVGWLALGFWRMARAQSGGEDDARPPAVTAAKIFVTTLLNPKALVFGLVLLPAGPSLPAAFISFVLQIVVVATLWATFGHLLRQADRTRADLPPWLTRLAAIWLAIVATLLAYRVVAA
jgi:threonine/homoserine/homoserine lactone efflux protein